MIRISDHAVIRYLERRYGFDFEAVRKEMDSPGLQMAEQIGCKSVKWNGGRLIIRGKVVVTYLANRMPVHPEKRVGQWQGR